MAIHVQTDNRKALVKAISEHFGQEQHYDGPPSFNYRVGAITVTRGCSIIGEQEDLEALKPFLEERGYITSERIEETDEQEPQNVENQPEQAEPMAIEGADPGNNNAVETETESVSVDHLKTDSGSDIQGTVITHTNTGLTVASLTNLIFMLYSKQYLLGKALGQQTIHISDEVIQELQGQRPENMGVFAKRIAEFRDQELMVGFDFKDDAVSMTFPYCEEEPTLWTVFTQLLTRMIQKAAEATRMRPALLIPESQAEKYYMNGWLMRLGYGGPDSKEQRRILMKNLQGYAAFKNAAGMEKHKEKYSAMRKAARDTEGGDRG